MLYSKTCESAIRALIYFAKYPKKKGAALGEIARFAGVSESYLAKIFQALASAKIVESRRGPTGGWQMVIPVQKLAPIHVMQALEDFSQSLFERCIMGLKACSAEHACPVHFTWMKAKKQILADLTNSTISDLAQLSGRFSFDKKTKSLFSKKMRKVFAGS